MAGAAEVWVDAVEEGEDSVVEEGAQYDIEGLAGDEADNVYGLADKH